MATSAGIVEHLLLQTAAAGHVTARKMFGEYGFYCGGKLVALICDDRFYIKPTKAGLEIIGEPVEAPPYPGAKPSYLIDEDRWDDSAWLSRLVKATGDALPPPKTKTKQKKKKVDFAGPASAPTDPHPIVPRLPR